MKRPGGLVGAGLTRLEEITGFTVVDAEHLRVQEAVAREATHLANELEEIGYVTADYISGRPNEPTATARRRWAQQARVVWQADPQAGAAVELLNEFTFGRGIPKPRAKDEAVQEIIDEFWDDPQNQRVLTSFVGQMRFGNSLSVQSNVWYLIFDEGDDGKVRLSFLHHDSVENAVLDPDNRQRVLYFTARKHRQVWDYKADRPKLNTEPPKVYYYEVWGAVEEALEERGAKRSSLTEVSEGTIIPRGAHKDGWLIEAATTDDVKITPPSGDRGWLIEAPDDEDGKLELAPRDRLGDGKVYHVAENNDMEQNLGVPRMRRTIRWYTAYNDFMKARVDMMMASAAFIMRRRVKGTHSNLEKLASKAMRATSDLRAVVDETRVPGPTPGSIIQETEAVEHEPFNLDSRAGNAVQDGQMLRAQVSAGDRFPQHYLGDVGSANLATATSMELPVLKHVEARQELVEGLFRFLLDRAIERAIDTGKLDRTAEVQEEEEARLIGVGQPETNGRTVLAEAEELPWRINGKTVMRETQITTDGENIYYDLLQETHEGRGEDERATERDLSYEFAMPSPLRRMMGDYVTAAVAVAQAFDPNNTNPELSRTLLTMILAEAFEMADASDIVDRIFPPGYMPPELAAMQQQQGMNGSQPNFFSPEAIDQPPDPENAYGAPKRATAPEDVRAQEAADEWEQPPRVTLGRNGQPVYWPGRRKPQAGDVAPQTDTRMQGRIVDLDRLYDEEVRATTMEALAERDMDRLVTAAEGTTSGKG
jgi:hypothetical protein